MEFRTFLENLNEEITCAICQETYGQPKLLPCLHTICVECLNAMAQRAIQGNRAAILCPLCNADVQIPQPDGNFDSLRNNIYVNRLKDIVAVREAGIHDVTCGNCEGKTNESSYCFQCCRFWCTKCEVAHKIVREYKGHRVLALKDFQDDDLADMLQRPAFCQQRDHENKFLEYYCNDCRTCICQMCLSLDHRTHRIQPIKEVARAYEADIAEQVTKAKVKLQEYIRGSTEIQERKVLVQENLESVKTDIHNTVEMLMASLKQQERELLADIEELAATSRDHLDTQLSNIRSNIDRLQWAIELAEGLVKRKSTLELLATKEGLNQRFDSLDKASVNMNPEVAVEGSFIPSKENTNLKLGYLRQSINPRKSTINYILAEKEIALSFTTRNQFGQECFNPEADMGVTITQRQHGRVVELPVQMKHKLNGEYSVTFTPQDPGEHEVSVQIGGSDICGSPFVVRGKSPEFISVKIIGKREFHGPQCVAVNVELNEFAVTDMHNYRVKIFDRDGSYLRQFGQKGSGQGMFQQPVGIVYDHKNNIVVSDYAKSTVSVFTKDGTFLKHLATKGNQDGQVKKPAALSVTDDKNIIVADGENNRIQVFSPEGQLVLKFGDTGIETLQDPMACVYYRDHYIVTDFGGQCVRLYDRRGQHMSKFEVPDDKKGAKFRPYGITGTKCGNIIVTDVGNHRLVMFRLDGTVIATTGTKGTDMGQFNYPGDVSLLGEDTIVVCDLLNNRLQVLKHP